jgi:hypothetical protein
MATEKQSTVSNLDIIPLHGGVNVVPAFMPDGSATTIIQAWRENGNAHGGREWLVLGPPAEESEHSPGIVTWNDPRRKALETIVGDSPFDGERVLGTIRFARGRVAGKAESLLLDAELDDAPSGILADHATATVRIFRLEATGGDPGDSPFEFKLISTQHSTKRYCNADLALSQMLNLPLPPNYGGPNQEDGCFHE